MLRRRGSGVISSHGRWHCCTSPTSTLHTQPLNLARCHQSPPYKVMQGMFVLFYLMLPCYSRIRNRMAEWDRDTIPMEVWLQCVASGNTTQRQNVPRLVRVPVVKEMDYQWSFGAPVRIAVSWGRKGSSTLLYK